MLQTSTHVTTVPLGRESGDEEWPSHIIDNLTATRWATPK